MKAFKKRILGWCLIVAPFVVGLSGLYYFYPTAAFICGMALLCVSGFAVALFVVGWYVNFCSNLITSKE